MQKKAISLSLAIFLIFTLCGFWWPWTPSVYGRADSWAYRETDKTAQADVFFICPTVYGGQEDSFNMSMDDEAAKASFVGATNMEKGIYDQDARFFAPYYRQAGLNVYELPAQEREP